MQQRQINKEITEIYYFSAEYINIWYVRDMWWIFWKYDRIDLRPLMKFEYILFVCMDIYTWSDRKYSLLVLQLYGRLTGSEPKFWINIFWSNNYWFQILGHENMISARNSLKPNSVPKMSINVSLGTKPLNKFFVFGLFLNIAHACMN